LVAAGENSIEVLRKRKKINFDELDAEKSMVMPFVLSLLF
jgi:hypothetical protein